ncbi:armadillo-type protein [Syncephalis fuscata]|nr:armadillo-type protein [Syncephalis fuscata]
MSQLNIADALLEIQEGEVEIEYDIRLEHLGAESIHDHLNDVVDRLEESPLNVTETKLFDKLRCFIRDFSLLRPHICNRVVDVLLTGMTAHIELVTRESQSTTAGGSLGLHRDALERYAFLLQWLTAVAESRENARNASEAAAAPTRVKRGRGLKKKATSDDADDHWDWSSQRSRLLDTVRRCSRLRLSRIWETGPELDTFINLVTKPAYLLMENVNYLKLGAMRTAIYSLIGSCIKHHNHGFAAQTTMMQNLQYYEHLSQPMADLLALVADQFGYSQLADSVLCEISNKEFNAQDTTGPKNFSKFLVRLSEIAPRVVLKQMVHLAKHLDSESYTMRMAVIETIGYILVFLLSQEPDETQSKQIEAFFDIVEERFRDVNSFCRCKVLQLCGKLCDGKAKFPKRRQKLIDLTISRLEDKSSHVRSNAIRVLGKFIETHPFVMDGGELSLSLFESKYGEITQRIESMSLPEGMVTPESSVKQTENEEGVPIALVPKSSSSDQEQEDEENKPMDVIASVETRLLDPATANEYMKLQLLQRYYTDAIRFSRQIDDAVPILCQLLASTNKTEVIDAMEFFEGIRRMVHLIWTKDAGADETKGVRGRLIDCYKSLYLSPIPSLSTKDNINLMARKLISLTFNTTLAELTSLEQLVATMMSEDLVPFDVIRKLWSVYSYNKTNMPALQRRGAIIILGMLAVTKKEVVTDHVDLLLKIGLGQFGRDDLSLAKYTCVALQRLLEVKRKGKGGVEKKQVRFPKDHAIFRRLKELIETPCTSSEWFPVAEQAINAIYLLSEHPDEICTDMLRTKAGAIFKSSPIDATATAEDMEEDTVPIDCFTSPYELSQLVFLAGHIGIKQIVHIELIEAELKRRKNEESDKKKALEKEKKAAQGDDELDQVTGTAEDDIADSIAQVREKELLYGKHSLLTVFGPMIVYICSNNKTFSNVTLQTAATVALTKFMCVSAEFCERHLPLLLTILEKSQEPTIRSNIMIALGDIAVCFNHLIEENISYVYKRLTDPDLAVKKNTLMVLTHLILNGMVKVKGQLGEMAKCIEDPDQRISDLSKLFFTELASKDNAVYNNLPDIISHLSVGANAVDEQQFIRIMKFLFEFIKDKHADNIVEKLCLRFKNSDDHRQWRDTGFCLSQLPFKTERSLKKLLDAMPLYEDKLFEDVLFKYFTDIIQKARMQKIQRAEVKLMIDDLERRITERREASGSQQATLEKAAKTATGKTRTPRGRKSSRAKKKVAATTDEATSTPVTRGRGRGRGRGRAAANESGTRRTSNQRKTPTKQNDDFSDDEEEEKNKTASSDTEMAEATPPTRPKRTPRSRPVKQQPLPSSSSSLQLSLVESDSE